MEKFKIGDTVRCVDKKKSNKPGSYYGFEPGKEFVVDCVRKVSGSYVYFPKNDYGVHECDLILVKTLPKSFACKNTNQVLWEKYIDWINTTYNKKQNGNNKFYLYYGIDKHGETGCHCTKVNFDTILTLEEWNEIVNGTKTKEINMKKYTITRDQLKSIHDVACDAWKSKIQTYTLRNPFGNTFEFAQEEVDTMFKAATLDQTPVLENIFGKQTREIDLSTGHVDGLELFIKGDVGTIDDTLMRVRRHYEYKNKAFLLNNHFDWKIVTDGIGCKCLVPTRK
jgi:hypothetical protein